MVSDSGLWKRCILADAIYFDSVNGVAGTAYPVGTAELPVNNLPDLRTICTLRNIRTIICLSNITLDSDMDYYHFISSHPRILTLNLNEQSIIDSTIEGFSVRGNQGGGKAIFRDCDFTQSDMTGLEADFWNCHFSGRAFTHQVNESCWYFNCSFGSYAKIHANSGDIHILNGKCHIWLYIYGPIAALSTIDIDGGHVELTNSLTESSTDIYLFGNFLLRDQSAGCRVFDLRDVRVAGEVRPRISFLEAWQYGTIDAAVWSVTNPATGTAWDCIAKNEVIVARCDPNASENARLRSLIRFPVPVSTVEADKIFYRLILEWEMQFESKTVLDNAACFFGLMENVAGDRGSDNIIGFGLTTDYYQAVSDKAGTEYTGSGQSGPLIQPTQRCLFRIEVWAGNPGRIIYYINNTVVGICTTANQQPAVPMYINFYTSLEAGGSDEWWTGPVRCWAEDYVLGREIYSQ